MKHIRNFFKRRNISILINRYLRLRFYSYKNIDSKPLLTFVSLGPGDPSLLTISAIDAIRESTLIAFPVSKRGAESLAAKIAKKWIQGKRHLPLIFPMTNKEDELNIAWKDASEKLALALEDGEKVAFICQGDASLYSTSAYILLYFQLHYPQYLLKVIPGVNSFSAAAAIGQLPLALQKEQLLICPVPEDPELFETLIDDAIRLNRVIAFLKLGNRWSWVRPILEKKGLLEKTLLTKSIGLSDEKVVKASDFNDDLMPYFSLVILRHSWPSKTT